MVVSERHQIQGWVAEQAKGGVLVEIGCASGLGILAMHEGTARGARLPIYGVDPYKPGVGRCGGIYGPEILEEFLVNTEGTDVTLFQQLGEYVPDGWTEPIAMLWIDLGTDYPVLRRIFDAWQGWIVIDGWLGISGVSYPRLGTRQLVRELVDGGTYYRELRDQNLVGVLRKRKVWDSQIDIR